MFTEQITQITERFIELPTERFTGKAIFTEIETEMFTKTEELLELVISLVNPEF